MRLNGFSEGLSLLAIYYFFLKIKKYLKKNQNFMSNHDIRELDPSTYQRARPIYLSTSSMIR